jgi:glutamyl-tRNA synthetase
MAEGRPPRARFAPSPTGYLHVGSAQSALFNWLFARANGGEFLLRIEDTDAERNRPELTDNVLDMLRWLGLEWDGEPVHQSDHTDAHRATALDMLDDVAMDITHVIRGEDHVNGTPKYLLLRAAVGAPGVPTFAHLPLLVNEQRKKLSKRRDDVSVADYKARGIVAEGMRNYLALLGWGPPDGVEVRPIEELVALFRLEDVNPSPAFFDTKKLEHVNGEWIRRLTVDDFIARAEEFVTGAGAVSALRELAPLAQERVKVLDELSEYFDWVDGPADDPRSWDKAMKLPVAGAAIDSILSAYADAPWEPEALHARFKDVAAGLETKESKLQGPIRVAVTGRIVGLPLFELLAYLGRDETLARLRAARARLG